MQPSWFMLPWFSEKWGVEESSVKKKNVHIYKISNRIKVSFYVRTDKVEAFGYRAQRRETRIRGINFDYWITKRINLNTIGYDKVVTKSLNSLSTSLSLDNVQGKSWYGQFALAGSTGESHGELLFGCHSTFSWPEYILAVPVLFTAPECVSQAANTIDWMREV